MEIFRQKPIFSLARTGYENLFRLRQDDGDYVDNRVVSLRAKTIVPAAMQGAGAKEERVGLIVGAHIRHGDKHPLDFMYRDSYIPTSAYVDATRDILDKSFPDDVKDMLPKMKSMLVVASDDPDVYDSDELSHALRAQEMISLGSKKSIESHTAGQKAKEEKDEGLIKRFAEETVGWEGGFFSGMFWSLGRPATSVGGSNNAVATGAPGSGSSTGNVAAQKPSAETLRLRELVGRAYLMDLAVLGQSDAIVCTVSAMGCKLLAVMMGWEDAFEVEGGQWKNVDGDFEWRGVSW